MFRRPLPVSPRLLGILALVVAGLATFVGYNAINGVPGYPYKFVTAHYATASNLTLHDDVRESSQRIGQVTAIDYRDGSAAVKLQINPGTKVYADARASIGDVSSLGSEFVEIDPGTPSAGPIGSAGIPVSHTTTPVEIDTVLSVLTPKVSDQLASAVQTLGVGVSGQGQNINDLIGNSTTLLPNLGAVNANLADPATNLSGLIDAANLLSSRFNDRTQQIAQLLGQFDTTLQAVNTQDTSALQATIADTAPALVPAIPALQALTTASAATGNALQALQPGFAAAGSNTPNLRALLRESVPPLDSVPPVARQAVPALSDLANTGQIIEKPTVPFLSTLINVSQPLLTYLAPYSNDTYALFNNLQSSLSQGNPDGNWLRIGIYEGAEAVALPGAQSTPAPTSATQCRDAYPAPGKAYTDGATFTGGTCP